MNDNIICTITICIQICACTADIFVLTRYPDSDSPTASLCSQLFCDVTTLVIISMDPLVLLPVDQWHNIKSFFKADWARSLYGYTVLDTAQVIIDRGCDYGFRVYCPYGDLENGMIAVNKKGSYKEYIIQCPNNTTKLEEALRDTKTVDWSETFELPFAPAHVKEVALKIAEEKRVQINHITVTHTFILNKNTLYDVRLPPGFTFEHLSLDYVQLIDSVWPHRYPASDWYFELLINAKLGYGLFDNAESKKQLIAWVFVIEMGALGHLYTLEEHRRKGYGEMVLKLISNALMRNGKTVFAFCVVGNDRAYNMYNKLGFDNIHTVEWITFSKIK